MKLKTITLNEDGKVETVFVLDKDQYHSLINHAINDLLAKGILSTMEISKEEAAQLQQEMLEKQQAAFLEAVETTDMPRA